MTDRNTIAVGIVIVLIFLWRFARTRQLYRTSLHVHTQGLNPIPFKPHDLRGFAEQALLGRRSIGPASFFIRAVVLAVVAVSLFPFKDFAPSLYRLVAVLIMLYVPWCVAHGVVLKKKISQ